MMERDAILPPQMSTAMDVARRLRAVILLAGRVGPNALADGIGRSILDLPIDPGRTILDHWIAHLAEFAESVQLPELLVRIAVDQHRPFPVLKGASSRVRCEILRDPTEFRGTGGIVRDLTRDYDASDLVLVASANQVQLEPVAGLFESLAAGGEGVSVYSQGGSEQAGVYLLEARRLRDVQDVGFVDLKEQAIPAARAKSPLALQRRPAGSAIAVRTLEEYVQAVRILHYPSGPAIGAAIHLDPFAETWRSVYCLVEDGAHVAPDAVVQDTVVLAGGTVESGAVVARSIVCEGGIVRRGACVVGAIVSASS